MGWIGFVLVLGLMASGLATPLLGQIGNLEETSSRRRALAEAWAPILFHDEAPEFVSPATGFSPVDTPVSLFFDGNRDVRDNGHRVFHLSEPEEREVLQQAPLYFSLIESRSHIYLNYMVYHAIDAKEIGHVHDTENIWIVLKKDGSPLGSLEMVVTNAHGFPMIYGPSKVEESIWRTRVPESVALQFLPLIDQSSSAHHDVGRPEFLPEPHSARFLAFVARLGHGIYKFNREAWKLKTTKAAIYVPESCADCRAQLGFDQELHPIRSMPLVDLDQILQEVFDDSAEEGLFDLQTRPKYSTRFSRERALPMALAPGIHEREGRIGLFYAQKLKTGVRLNDPARVHLYFNPENTQVSTTYLYNYYLKPGIFVADAKPNRRSAAFNFNRASLLYFMGRIFD